MPGDRAEGDLRKPETLPAARLTERLPAMVTPRRVRNRVQP